MRERRQREQQLRSVEMRLREKPKGMGPAPTLEQADQDFKRILILHNELVRSISAGAALDYKLTSEAAAEINKRANRLKKFLVQPGRAAEAEDEEERVGLNGQQLRVAVVVLCERIESFVENPLFKQPGVVDVRESARAGEDLLRIIKLSDGIRRDAVRLGKTLK
jgi:hypothetical protein